MSIPVGISNSEILTFMKCRRKWWLQYVEGYKSKEIAVVGALPLGSRVHAALEAYYKHDADLVKVYQMMLDEDRTMLEANGMDTKTLESEGELGRLMLEGYLEWVATEGIDALYEVIGVEEVLSMPMLGGKVNVIGKIDLRVRDLRDGSHLVLDHKGQPLDEVVLTPHGWEPIGKLEVGDTVIGSAWQPIRVLGVYERGVRDVYRVSFTDGTSVRCDDEHLWSVQFDGTSPTSVVGIQEIKLRAEKSGTFIDRSGVPRYKRAVHIPAVTVNENEKRRTALMLEPYTLGAWISDGSADGTAITDALHERQRLEYAGCRNVREQIRPGSSALSGSLPDRGRDALRRLNLLGTHSHERFIPDVYMHASYPDRLELVRGLMDGDGSITKSGSSVYMTSSSRLAEDFALIARSLGWQASIWKHADPHFIYKGERRVGRPAYRVNITTDVNPFMFSARNQPIWENKHGGASIVGRRDRRKRIAFIEQVESSECRCIKVESDDNLYVTAGGVLTHNTAAQLGDFESWAHMNPQLMTYQTLDFIEKNKSGSGDNRLAGGIFRVLKKVKRTTRSTPPYYNQFEIRHNVFTLRSFWHRLNGVLANMLAVREALEKGADHRQVAYATPTRDCRWACPFFAGCLMFDDGSDHQEYLNEYFVKGNPYDYYRSSDDDDTTF